MFSVVTAKAPCTRAKYTLHFPGSSNDEMKWKGALIVITTHCAYPRPHRGVGMVASGCCRVVVKCRL